MGYRLRMAVVLLVAKTPLARRLAQDERERLENRGVLDGQRLAASADRQDETLLAVRAALAGETVRERRFDQLQPTDSLGIDLVITVGGDGTVFTANTLATAVPYFTVNSDPEHSVGHFTRFTAITVAAGVQAWKKGAIVIEELHRLSITVEGVEHFILNDCLFAHSNPAVLSRYVLEVDGQREFQRSSGVWVSTAHGSTAAIHSAGAVPVASHLAALLYKVREPFLAREAVHLLGGSQLPPSGLQLTPAIPGMALYLDGPNITVPVLPGMTVAIRPAKTPLRLVRLP